MTTELDILLAECARNHAETTHAQYPQYAGHWEGWKRVRVKRDITTKMGKAFLAGDITIGKPPVTCGLWEHDYCILYSFRNGIDTSVSVYDCAFLED